MGSFGLCLLRAPKSPPRPRPCAFRDFQSSMIICAQRFWPRFSPSCTRTRQMNDPLKETLDPDDWAQAARLRTGSWMRPSITWSRCESAPFEGPCRTMSAPVSSLVCRKPQRLWIRSMMSIERASAPIRWAIFTRVSGAGTWRPAISPERWAIFLPRWRGPILGEATRARRRSNSKSLIG